jgi:hypothetical protein
MRDAVWSNADLKHKLQDLLQMLADICSLGVCSAQKLQCANVFLRMPKPDKKPATATLFTVVVQI